MTGSTAYRRVARREKTPEISGKPRKPALKVGLGISGPKSRRFRARTRTIRAETRLRGQRRCRLSSGGESRTTRTRDAHRPTRAGRARRSDGFHSMQSPPVLMIAVNIPSSPGPL